MTPFIPLRHIKKLFQKSRDLALSLNPNGTVFSQHTHLSLVIWNCACVYDDHTHMRNFKFQNNAWSDSWEHTMIPAVTPCIIFLMPFFSYTITVSSIVRSRCCLMCVVQSLSTPLSTIYGSTVCLMQSIQVVWVQLFGLELNLTLGSVRTRLKSNVRNSLVLLSDWMRTMSAL